MSRLMRFATLSLSVLLLLTATGAADAQRRPAPPRHPVHPRPAVVVRGQVFVGGYFYDPSFGIYPWWPRRVYPYWYFPVFDTRAELRIRATPEEAAVYVDGFYAGIVEDFDGVFQGLALTPGGHSIVLYLEGYRTVRHNVYLRPGSTLKLRDTMERLVAGVKSDPPELAPPLPPPPAGSYTTPRTHPPVMVPQTPATSAEAVAVGTLDLYVQPVGAELRIDGERWVSSEEGHFLLHVPIGKHRIELDKPQYRPFATEIEVREGESLPLNVVLMPATS